MGWGRWVEIGWGGAGWGGVGLGGVGAFNSVAGGEGSGVWRVCRVVAVVVVVVGSPLTT